jgi:hypothetical protein
MSILTSVDTASLKALIPLIPASMLFVGSIYVFFGAKTVWSFLQLLGAVCLLGVPACGRSDPCLRSISPLWIDALGA